MRLTAKSSLSVRADFARHHLRAAAQAARVTYDIEIAGNAKTLGPGFDEIMASVPAAVLMAAAALEANSNELIQDIIDASNKTGAMGKAKQLLLSELKNAETGNAVDRYRTIALLQDKVPDKGQAAWGEAKLLIKFRNFFMHFKPSWASADETPDKLAKTFEKKFSIAEPYKGNASYMFPHACLTYECAKWSIDTVLQFSRHISKVLDVVDRLDTWRPPTPLP
jgi:hypothetical protein